MPPKKDAKSSAKQPQKTQKKKEGSGGGKAKKKKDFEMFYLNLSELESLLVDCCIEDTPREILYASQILSARSVIADLPLEVRAIKLKWSKGKVRDKLNNQVLFDKATYEKLYKEVPSYKLITPSVVSERLKVRGSLARRALIELQQKGLIKQVVQHRAQLIYTRTTKGDDPVA